jgi:hypothetical protein
MVPHDQQDGVSPGTGFAVIVVKFVISIKTYVEPGVPHGTAIFAVSFLGQSPP